VLKPAKPVFFSQQMPVPVLQSLLQSPPPAQPHSSLMKMHSAAPTSSAPCVPALRHRHLRRLHLHVWHSLALLN